LPSIGEGEHESVTLTLDHVAVVVVDQLLDEPVVPLQHLHPSSVAQGLVVCGGILYVGQNDYDGIVKLFQNACGTVDVSGFGSGM
jgi:hypothetical protein